MTGDERSRGAASRRARGGGGDGRRRGARAGRAGPERARRHAARPHGRRRRRAAAGLVPGRGRRRDRRRPAAARARGRGRRVSLRPARVHALAAGVPGDEPRRHRGRCRGRRQARLRRQPLHVSAGLEPDDRGDAADGHDEEGTGARRHGRGAAGGAPRRQGPRRDRPLVGLLRARAASNSAVGAAVPQSRSSPARRRSGSPTSTSRTP